MINRLFRILITTLLPSIAFAQNTSPVLDAAFIYDTAPFPECHAATIAETSKGLITAFFGGTEERAPDVCIYVSRKDHGSDHWSAPKNVANGIQNAATGVRQTTLRYPCWNPVLYQIPGGDLLLFYKVGPSPDTWKGWLTRSKDGGTNWSEPEPLPEGFLGPIKNQPILAADGTLICPSSREGNGWQVKFELTRDNGRTWQMANTVPTPPPAKNGAEPNSEEDITAAFQVIQPALFIHKDGIIQALCRSKSQLILTTESKDNGHTWSTLRPTSLPNNNSGLDGTTLKDGRLLLVYNHVLPPNGKSRGERSPLNVAISSDGMTWWAALTLENDHTGEYSYPSVIQSADGMVHIVYTWHRKKIKYIKLDPSKLTLVKITTLQWPI
jgi:alpha-L-rhamnosidase